MQSFFALAFAGVASATLMQSSDYDFMRYITKFNKRYDTVEEFNLRKELYKFADHEIEEFNARSTTSKMGHNKFSDWTEDEYQQLMGFLNEAPLNEGNKTMTFEPTEETEVDWVAKGAVTEVKNQGSCGSCWSFSTTGSMEGAHFLATGNLVSLSEQNLVDCSHNGNLGCMGGMMDRAFKWTESHSLESEADYPYQGWTLGAGCRYNADKG